MASNAVASHPLGHGLGAQPVEGQLTPASRSSDASVEAWNNFLLKLGDKEVERLKPSNFTYDAAKARVVYMQDIEIHCKKQGKSSTLLKLARWIQPLCNTLSKYAPAAGAYSQAYPNPSSLVLGALLTFVQINTSFTNFYEKVAHTLAVMLRKAEYMDRYSFYIEMDGEVRFALIEVLIDILEFCHKARKYFVNKKDETKSAVTMAFSSLWKDYEDEFNPIYQRYQSNLDNFKDQIDFLKTLRSQNFRSIHTQYAARNEDRLNQLASIGMNTQSDVRDIKIEQERKRFRDQRNDLRRKKVLVLEWIFHVSTSTNTPEKDNAMVDGTGQWLFDMNEYTRWTDTLGSSLLYIKGKGGCGKSFLARSIIDSLEDSISSAAALAYVFCDRKSAALRQTSSLMRSILHQLCHQLTLIDLEVETIYDNAKGSNAASVQLKRVQECLESCAKSFSDVYIVLDGLDECDDDEEIASIFQNLIAKESSKVKVAILGRSDFPNLDSTAPQTITMDATANSDDIRKLILHITSRHKFPRSSSKDEQEKLCQDLLTNVNGSFMILSRFQPTLLKQKDFNSVRRVVDDMPKELFTMWGEAMRNIVKQEIPERDNALDALFWIANSKRPLSRQELLEAISVCRKRANPAILGPDDVGRDPGFSELCQHMIHVDRDGYYQVAHASVRDFLLSLKESDDQLFQEYKLRQGNPSKILAETCLTYILLERFRGSPPGTSKQVETMKIQNPFLQYAATHWALHVMDDVKKESLELVSQLLRSQNPLSVSVQTWIADTNMAICTKPSTITPLHALAAYGLKDSVALIEDFESQIHSPDSWGRFPFDYALIGHHEDMANWLIGFALKSPEDWNAYNGTLLRLHLAIPYEWHIVVDALIKLGHDINAAISSSKLSPLGLATGLRKGPLVKLLLDANADIDWKDINGDTALITAVSDDQEDIVNLLLEAQPNMDTQNNQGRTAVSHAVANGNLDMIKLLCKHGASVNIPTATGETIVHEAAQGNQSKIVLELSKHGADLRAKAENNQTPLMEAAANNAVEVVDVLLKLEDQLNDIDAFGNTVLHYAAAIAETRLLELLVDVYKCPVNVKSDSGATPLYFAAEEGNSVAVEFLLSRGALPNHRSTSGETALHRALHKQHMGIVRQLLSRGADPNILGVLESPALHYAAFDNLVEVVPDLLRHNADVATINENKDSAIHFASSRGHVEFLKALQGTDITKMISNRNKKGNTALHDAASNGHSATVSYLLEIGEVDLPLITNNDGELALHLASCSGDAKTVELLLTPDLINSKGFRGNAPLHVAAFYGPTVVVDLLLDAGADQNARNDSRSVPALLALQNKQFEVAKLLLESGTDITAVDNHGASLLWAASVAPDKYLVEKLLTLGCDGLQLTQRGMSPFHGAVLSGDVDMLQSFLNRDINDCNNISVSGTSCLMAAMETSSIEMLRKLIELGANPHNTDVRGGNAAYYAASAGQVHMLRELKQLNVDIHRPRHGATPLCVSAGNGRYSTVIYLLDSGATHHERTADSNMSALALATAFRRRRCTRLLRKAGADPYVYDCYGLTPYDYAKRYTPVEANLGPIHEGYKALTPGERDQVLRHTIYSSIERLTTHSTPLSSAATEERFQLLFIVAFCLIYLSDSDHRDDAATCFGEVVFPPERAISTRPFYCDGCCSSISYRDIFVCMFCFETYLCSACHNSYLKAGNTLFPLVRDFDLLEEPLHEMASCALPVLSLSPETLKQSLLLFEPLVEILTQKLEKYDQWLLDQTGNGELKNASKLGYEFTKLVLEITVLATQSEDESMLSKELHLTVEKLDKQCKSYGVGRDYKIFTCAGHDYINISKDIWEKGKKSGTTFGPDERLSLEWLTEMRARACPGLAETYEQPKIFSVFRQDPAEDSSSQPGTNRTNIVDTPRIRLGSSFEHSTGNITHILEDVLDFVIEVSESAYSEMVQSLIPFYLENFEQSVTTMCRKLDDIASDICKENTSQASLISSTALAYVLQSESLGSVGWDNLLTMMTNAACYAGLNRNFVHGFQLTSWALDAAECILLENWLDQSSIQEHLEGIEGIAVSFFGIDAEEAGLESVKKSFNAEKEGLLSRIYPLRESVAKNDRENMNNWMHTSLNLAATRSDLGDIEAAIECLERVLQATRGCEDIDSTNLERLLGSLGVFYYRTDRFNDAIAVERSVVSSRLRSCTGLDQSPLWNAYKNLAMTLFKIGKYDAAEAFVSLSIRSIAETRQEVFRRAEENATLELVELLNLSVSYIIAFLTLRANILEEQQMTSAQEALEQEIADIAFDEASRSIGGSEKFDVALRLINTQIKLKKFNAAEETMKLLVPFLTIEGFQAFRSSVAAAIEEAKAKESVITQASPSEPSNAEGLNLATVLTEEPQAIEEDSELSQLNIPLRNIIFNSVSPRKRELYSSPWKRLNRHRYAAKHVYRQQNTGVFGDLNIDRLRVPVRKFSEDVD